jgi:hypothetical protein
MLEFYILGAVVHLIAGFAWLAHASDTDESRNAAKLMWVSPVWPLLWVFGICYGLYRFFRFAWIDD